MTLQVISTTTSFMRDISWLEIDTVVGNFVIRPGHAPTVLMLDPGKPIIFCLSNGKQETLSIGKGIVEITRTKATVLINE